MNNEDKKIEDKKSDMIDFMNEKSDIKSKMNTQIQWNFKKIKYTLK